MKSTQNPVVSIPSQRHPPTADGEQSHDRITDLMSAASLMDPRHPVPSAWLEHGPFGMWLVQAMRPRTIVELGTHNGYSFYCFCQAVREAGLASACYAVDTWAGDEHAGTYDDSVYHAVRAVVDQHYADIATLMRSTFDDALGYFPDGSIDLLHIDGRHFLEDVRHDYESWLPKLSDQGVVLFHDTNVRERGFGVWRLWRELRSEHPSFEFLHGHGLGVLAVGDNVGAAVTALTQAGAEPAVENLVRAIYGRLGSHVKRRLEHAQAHAHCDTRCHAAEQMRAELESTASALQVRLEELSRQLATATRRLSEIDAKVGHERRRFANSQLYLEMAAQRRYAVTRCQAEGLHNRHAAQCADPATFDGRLVRTARRLSHAIARVRTFARR